jgi:hypothetical protein
MIDVVYDVKAYRRLLAETVGDGQTVLEIGPHLGKSTDSYVEKAKLAVLVDKGTDGQTSLAEYAMEHENVEYVCGDARGFDAMSLVLKHISSCDVFAIDLGGGRYPDTVFKVWATWAGVFKPEKSVIRCRGLAEFLRRAKVRDDSLPVEFEDSGWLAEYGRKTPAQLRQQLDEFSHWVDV